MVFVIQDSQNRDSVAIQTKLDELIRVSSPTSRLEGIEDLTQDEIEVIKESRKKGNLGRPADEEAAGRSRKCPQRSHRSLGPNEGTGRSSA